METTNEPLHLHKWGLVQQKVIDKSTSFVLITVLLSEVFNCGNGARFWGYVRTNTEPLFAEFCNSVQSQNFLNYLTC
jgi:hypothetical protein